MSRALATADEDEEALILFLNGCDLMQTQIAAWLMFQGHLDLAAKVLEMPPPKFQQQEKRVANGNQTSSGSF